MQMLPYDKGLLIHRKRSPFPDKGRLVGIDCASGDLLIIIYKQIKMQRTTKQITLSLPLSGKGTTKWWMSSLCNKVTFEGKWGVDDVGLYGRIISYAVAMGECYSFSLGVAP